MFVVHKVRHDLVRAGARGVFARLQNAGAAMSNRSPILCLIYATGGQLQTATESCPA